MTTPTIKPSLYAGATWEPVELDEAKKHLEIADAVVAHDAAIRRMITTAREIFEEDTGLVCCQSTWTLKLDEWPDSYIVLPIRPVTSITSITYLDTAGASQTWGSTNYTLDQSRVVPAVFLTYGASYPTARSIENAITVTFVAGYASKATVPERVRQAIMIKTGQLFFERVGVVSIGEVQFNRPAEFASAYQALINRMLRTSYP